MAALAIAELTDRDRGILATSALAACIDGFSSNDRLPLSDFQTPCMVPRQRTYYSRGQACKIEWQDYGQPLPAWFDPLMQGFVDLRTLPPNWNSYGAGSIEERLLNNAMNFVASLLGPNSPAPRVVPLSSGGLQLEWHRQGIDLEVVFDRDEQPFFHYEERANGCESEHVLPQESGLLKSIIGKLE